MIQTISQRYIIMVQIFERILGAVVFAGIIVMVGYSIPLMVSLDWSDTRTFYELIYRVLLAVIGLELVRMLITHYIIAVLELLAFVIARKMLKPDLSAIDIALSVFAFVALVIVHQIIINKGRVKK